MLEFADKCCKIAIKYMLKTIQENIKWMKMWSFERELESTGKNCILKAKKHNL